MRRHLFLFILLSFGPLSYAQVTSNSPYSVLGLGEQGGLDHAAAVGIGNSTITMLDSTIVNYYNPASYNLLGTGHPLVSIGVSSRLSRFSELNTEFKSSVTALQHFALSFPFRKHFGLTFGLKPYSRRGYEFTSRALVDGDSLKYTYSGVGGINEVFLGFSTDIFKLEKSRLAVGANFGYLFGSTLNQRAATLIQSTSEVTGGVEQRKIQMSSFHYDFGTYFTHNFNKSHSLLLSATFDLGQELTGKFEQGRYYAINVNAPITYDTLTFVGDSSGTVSTAPTLSYGLRYTISRRAEKEKNRRLNSEWSIHATYSTTDWSKFRNPFDNNSSTFLNTQKYTFGIQYIPETEYLSTKASSKYVERMRYRIGAYFYTLPYESHGEQISDFGTTFGLGLPIAISHSRSSFNVGFSFGRRGVSNSQSLNERYYGINIGISISPVGDRWFVKRKLD